MEAHIIKSVDMYNDWFLKFAPHAFRTTRVDHQEGRTGA